MRLDAGAYARLLLMETNREVCASSFRGIDIRKQFSWSFTPNLEFEKVATRACHFLCPKIYRFLNSSSI